MKNLFYLFIAFIIFSIASCEKVETEDSFATEDSEIQLRNEENNMDIINKVTLEEVDCISQSAKNKIFMDSDRDTMIVKKIEELKDNENELNTLMFVVSYEEGGFIIVSADKRFMPILAFGDTEEWGSEDMGGIDVWVHCTKEEIKKNMTTFEEPPKHIQVQWDNYLKDDCDLDDPHDPVNPVDPDEPDYPHGPGDPTDPPNPPDPPETDPCPRNTEWWETGQYVDTIARWRQGGIFSFYSPEDDDCDPCDRKPAGCGAVAMSMVMSYYESPTGNICWGLQGTPNCVTLNSLEYSNMPVTVSPWNCGVPTGGDLSASILTRVC